MKFSFYVLKLIYLNNYNKYLLFRAKNKNGRGLKVSHTGRVSKQIAWTLYNILTSVIRIISNSQPEPRGSKSVCLLLPLNLLPLREEAIIKDLVETGYTEFHYHKNLCEIIRSGKVVEKWFTIRYVLMTLIWVIIRTGCTCITF